MKNFLNKYCVVRSANAGVFFGIVKRINGEIVEMEKTRKLYYWDGAFAVEGLAQNGVTKPQNCKFTCFVDNLIINGVNQILICSEKSIESLSAVPVWKV